VCTRCEGFDPLEDSIKVGLDEDRFRAFGSDAVVRGLIDPSSLHHTAVGEFVDDEVDELDLVLAVALVIEEVGERRCRSAPIAPLGRIDQTVPLAELEAGSAGALTVR
jgi:hypothetical protein